MSPHVTQAVREVAASDRARMVAVAAPTNNGRGTLGGEPLG